LPYRLSNHGQTYRDTPVYRYTPTKKQQKLISCRAFYFSTSSSLDPLLIKQIQLKNYGYRAHFYITNHILLSFVCVIKHKNTFVGGGDHESIISTCTNMYTRIRHFEMQMQLNTIPCMQLKTSNTASTLVIPTQNLYKGIYILYLHVPP
jgi:hypothetical protein